MLCQCMCSILMPVLGLKHFQVIVFKAHNFWLQFIVPKHTHYTRTHVYKCIACNMRFINNYFLLVTLTHWRERERLYVYLKFAIWKKVLCMHAGIELGT